LAAVRLLLGKVKSNLLEKALEGAAWQTPAPEQKTNKKTKKQKNNEAKEFNDMYC